jgi:hypothetical protein
MGYRYSSTLSLTSALDGVGCQRDAPAALPPPPVRPRTPRTGGWVGPRAGLDRCGKSRPHRRFWQVSSVTGTGWAPREIHARKESRTIPYSVVVGENDDVTSFWRVILCRGEPQTRHLYWVRDFDFMLSLFSLPSPCLLPVPEPDSLPTTLFVSFEPSTRYS